MHFMRQQVTRKSTDFLDSSTKTASGTWLPSKSFWSSILSATFAAIPVDPLHLTRMETYSYLQETTLLHSTNLVPDLHSMVMPQWIAVKAISNGMLEEVQATQTT